MNRIEIPLALKEILADRDDWVNQKGMAPLAAIRERVGALPEIFHSSLDVSGPAVRVGSASLADQTLQEELEQISRALIPWRKGPFNLMGLEIDAEWRSDLKWQRLEKALPKLEGKAVLDVGCNNGYFMFKLLEHKPRLILGIDPVPVNQVQFELIKRYSGASNLQLELLGVEHLNHFPEIFDTIFSMGILYHHRHPLEQLHSLKNALKHRGVLILESIVIPGPESVALFPSGRYAKMKNVWFIPTVSCLENMLKRCGFKDVELIDFGKTTPEEQRLTDWCPPPKQSLSDFLDPDDSEKTIEGYPAPYRAIFKACKVQ